MQNVDKNDIIRSETLQLRLLGSPRIILHGALLTGITSAKAQGLLFYLAVTRGRYARSTLAALFWGDLSESAARGNLRKALQQLRKYLGVYLIIERNNVSLAENTNCWVDTVEFDVLLQETSRVEVPDQLQSAIDLYLGDFLEGFYLRNALEFENWWLSERARLREKMLDALLALADHHAEDGHLDRAITLTRRYLELEPWREGAHRRLMSLLARSGQRSAALAQYEVCRQILADELAVEPAEETTILYQRIKKDEMKAPLSVASRLLEIEPELPPFLSMDAGSPSGIREIFVGREKQLDRLENCWKRSITKQGRVVLVCGEAGSGKTSLVNEFSHRILESYSELVVTSGTCDVYTSGGDPYLPFREMLQIFTGDLEGQWQAGNFTQAQVLRQWQLLPDVVQSLLDHGPELLGTLISRDALIERMAAYTTLNKEGRPLLSKLVAFPENQTDDPDTNQDRLFAAYTAILISLSSWTPLLLILDDLHWADRSSLGLLAYLSRRLVGHSILLVGTYRPENVARDRNGQPHPLSRLLSELKHLFGDIEINLDRVGRTDKRGFVDELLDAEPNRLSEAFRQKLARHTQGNPLFTIETIKEMQERGDLCQDNGGRWISGRTIQWDRLPARVEGVIERRIGRLDPDLKELLTVASIEGETFTTEVLAQVTGDEARSVVRRLSGELDKIYRLVTAQGIERVAGQRLSRYRFRHQLIQKHLYHSLDEIERAFLHEDLANALEMIYIGHTETIAVQLAEHFLDGGVPEKAIGYLIQAGDAAAQAYAHVETIAFYERALGLSSQVELGNQALTRLYARLGRALELNSSFDRALAIYAEMEQKAIHRQDRAMLLSALAAQVTIQAMPSEIRDPDRTEVIGERALSLAYELGDQEAEAKILWSLSISSFFNGRLLQAIDNGERSLSLARELNLRRQLAQTLNDLGSLVYIYSGQIKQAITYLVEATAIWRELGNQPMLADSLASSCVANVFAGKYDRAILLSEEALQISQSIDNIWGQSYSRWKVGFAFWDRGDVSRAIMVMEDCIQLGKQAGFMPSQSYTQADLAAIYGDLGTVDKGLQTAAAALQMSENFSPIHRAYVLGIMAHLYILKGELIEAGSLIQEGKNDPHRESWPVFYVVIPLVEIELALAQQEFTKAENLANEALVYLQQYGMRIYTAYVLYLEGSALLGLGQINKARECFTAARSEAETIGFKRILWRVLHALSTLETDPGKAEHLHLEARQVVEYIVAHIECGSLRASFTNLPAVKAVLGSI